MGANERRGERPTVSYHFDALDPFAQITVPGDRHLVALDVDRVEDAVSRLAFASSKLARGAQSSSSAAATTELWWGGLRDLDAALHGPRVAALAGEPGPMSVQIIGLASLPIAALPSLRYLSPVVVVPMPAAEPSRSSTGVAVVVGPDLGTAGQSDIAAVEDAWGAGVEIVEGDAATAERVVELLATKSVVHIAGHHALHPDHGSTVELIDGPLDPGLVTRPGPGVVVLAACGAMDRDPSEEGLVPRLLAAGAARVVAALWAVNDAATATAVTAPLHLELAAGRSAADALRIVIDRAANAGDPLELITAAGFGVFAANPFPTSSQSESSTRRTRRVDDPAAYPRPGGNP